MYDDRDDEDSLIDQNEDDFVEEDALDDGQGTTFRRPSDPLTLVLGEKDRSTTLDLEKKRKEILNIKVKLGRAIGECRKRALLLYSCCKNSLFSIQDKRGTTKVFWTGYSTVETQFGLAYSSRESRRDY